MSLFGPLPAGRLTDYNSAPLPSWVAGLSLVLA
jgi:hypothetical protein